MPIIPLRSFAQEGGTISVVGTVFTEILIYALANYFENLSVANKFFSSKWIIKADNCINCHRCNATIPTISFAITAKSRKCCGFYAFYFSLGSL